MLEGCGKGMMRVGSKSVSSIRLDREIMSRVGGDGMCGLWWWVSSMAVESRLSWME